MPDVIKALEEARDALKPFADCTYNDNGDCTVSHRPFSYDEMVAAYFAHCRLEAALASLKGGVAVPVAWQCKATLIDGRTAWITMPGDWSEKENVKGYEYRPLYASPPPADDAGVAREDWHDVVTHRSAWRSAIENCLAMAGNQDDDANVSYWTHELGAFDRTFAKLATLSAKEQTT